MKKSVILVLFALLFSFMPITNAAGLTIYADLTADTNDDGGMNVTEYTTMAEINASTSDDIFVGFDASADGWVSTDTVTFTVDSSWTVTDGAIATCGGVAVDSLDVDDDGTPDIGSITGDNTAKTVTYTLDATLTTETSGVEFCLPVTTGSAGNYSVEVNASRNTDFGSFLVYVGDDNNVTVTASVETALNFDIVVWNDTTTTTNTCALGTLTTSSVSTCAYRLRVSTNASDGYTVVILSNGDLSKSGTGDVSDINDLDLISEGGTVTAGTEGYGIAFNGGSATVGSITELGDFSDDDTPLPTSMTTLYTSNGPNVPSSSHDATNTALVDHKAAIDTNTATGNYSQTISYYVAADF